MTLRTLTDMMDEAELLFNIVTQHAHLKEYWTQQRPEVHMDAKVRAESVLLSLPQDRRLAVEEVRLRVRAVILLDRIDTFWDWEPN